MNTGDNLRFTIHNILYDVRKYGVTLDKAFSKILNKKISSRDIAFMNNVSLNTMRYSIHSKKILLMYVKKKPKIHEEILLCSAITQIIFLDFKEYAVINSTVEISKKLKLFHGFINACLRKITKDKKKLKNIKINYSDLPIWFKNKTKNLTKFQKNLFLENFYSEPNIHLVFRNKLSLSNFEEELSKTSEISGFLVNKLKLENIPSYKNGNWWVQDYSSSFPLCNVEEEIINKSCLDMCAAPGGKSFQILSKNKKIDLNDISIKRTKILRENLKRLNFKPNITNIDINNLEKKEKYDFIILDAPCSAIGTIRKNPEIFYREKEPKLEELINLQKKMLDVASKILKENGIILYMVCSFLKIETTCQINNFLLTNKNFSLNDFSFENKNLSNNQFIKNKKMLVLPSVFNNYNIDGYFAVYLRKER